MIEVKETNTFIEIDILKDGVKIGGAEVEPNEHCLERFFIYDSEQNKGYGKQALETLIKRYGIDNLWVRSDNAIAHQLYVKNGFTEKGRTMIEMRLSEKGKVNGN